jgi:hypothetical protein
LSVNVVVQSGRVKSMALKYDSHSRPELRWTLEQTEYATDGKSWTLWLPCCASGSAAERLAGELEDGQAIVITSGKLCYRKRQTKIGEQSRLEILVWSVSPLTESPQAERSPSTEERDQGPETGQFPLGGRKMPDPAAHGVPVRGTVA